jgi:hypothetical protein
MGFRDLARAAAAAACILVCTALADAAPFTGAFDALSTDLQARQIADYAPPLTTAQQAELKAIHRSLANLARPHDDVADDVASAAFVAKALRRGFPAEFDPNTARSGLANLVAGVFRDLAAAVEAQYGKLDDAIAAIPDATARTTASAKLGAARSALDAAAAPGAAPATAAKQLLRALRLVRRGLAIASPWVDGYFTARVNGRLFTASQVRQEYVAGISYLNVVASRTDPASGTKQSIALFVRSPAEGSFEIGAFDIFSGNWALYFEGDPKDDVTWYSQFTDPASAVTITEFDPDARRVAGTFSFLAMRDGTSRKTVTAGAFLLTDLDVQ